MVKPVLDSVTYKNKIQLWNLISQDSAICTYDFLVRVDDQGLVLLGGGLDDVEREAVPQEVHQGVRRGHVLLLDRVLILDFLDVSQASALPGPDGDRQDDAQDDGQHGGGQIVDHSTEADLASLGQIH